MGFMSRTYLVRFWQIVPDGKSWGASHAGNWQLRRLARDIDAFAVEPLDDRLSAVNQLLQWHIVLGHFG